MREVASPVTAATVPAGTPALTDQPGSSDGVPVDAGTPASGVPNGGAAQASRPNAASQPASGAPANNASGAQKATQGTSTAAPSAKGPERSTGATSPAPVPDGGVTPAPAAPGGAKSPVILASVGTYSGPAGGVLAPIMAGSQVWVKWINQKGGLNGHPITFIVYDDAGDPARHSAQVREAVERRNAIAFLSNAEAITGQSGAAYITSKRVPVVGMSGGENWAAESPTYFPQKSFGPGLYQLFPRTFAPVMVPKGLTRWGITYCVEAPGCKDVDKTMADEGAKLGYQLVYRSQASIAQPDFTAECLAARNAGVQAMMVLLDQTSLERFATACNRQGYRPQYLIPSQALADRLKDNPLLDGAVSVTDVFPWFVSGTPAYDEFRAAMKAFGASVPPGLGPAEGWVSGKLLEVVSANVAEPPTSAQILAGLWKVKNNNLGGITAPLTFTENQPTKPYACGALVMISSGKWVTPDPTVKCYP